MTFLLVLPDGSGNAVLAALFPTLEIPSVVVLLVPDVRLSGGTSELLHPRFLPASVTFDSVSPTPKKTAEPRA